MIEFFSFVLVCLYVLALIQVFSLRSRVNRIEKELSEVLSGKKSAISSAESSVGQLQSPATQPVSDDQARNFFNASDLTQVQQPQSVQGVSKQASDDMYVSMFFNWLRENWLLKIGVLLILVGFGWFVSYAFVHNWIGPIGRIALGFVAGSLIMAFGDSRMKKYIHQGGVFIILGAAIILITVFAARFIYGFFNPVIALSIVFVVSAYITLTSLRYNVRALAISGLIIASIAPGLTNAPAADVIARYLYLAVVSLASIWVMFQTRWRILGALSSFILIMYSVVQGFSLASVENKFFILTLVYVLAFVYFVSNIISITREKENMDSSDVALAILNGILIISWTIIHGPEEWKSLLLALWMIIFAIGSFVVFTKTKSLQYFYVYSLESIVLLATATSFELDGSALVFAFIFESAIISLVGYAITTKSSVGHNLSLLMIFPALMSLESISSAKWMLGAFHQDFGILLSVSIVLIGLGLIYYYVYKEDHPGESASLELKPHSLMIIVGSFYVYVLIWLTLKAVMMIDSSAVILSLVIYTVIGISTYFYGKTAGSKVFKYYGTALLVCVVARLIFIDVWRMDLAPRIFTFIIIGALLVSTAFIGNNKQHE